ITLPEIDQSGSAELPFEHLTGHQFDDALYQRERSRNVVDAQEGVKRLEAYMPCHVGMSKDALQLGPKENLSLMQTVIKRLDAHAIARKNKPALRLNPQTDGKHSPESLEARIRSEEHTSELQSLAYLVC